MMAVVRRYSPLCDRIKTRIAASGTLSSLICAPLRANRCPSWRRCVLDALGALQDPMVDGALRYLQSITTPGGGVPFVLPSASIHPHAFWWEEQNPSPPWRTWKPLLCTSGDYAMMGFLSPPLKHNDLC